MPATDLLAGATLANLARVSSGGSTRRHVAAAPLDPSGRLPSEAQLVKRFGVSRPTVARAFRDLQDEGLIERRVGSGTYVRSRASGPSPGGGRQFGLMIPGLGTTEIFEAICGELAGLARGHEYGLLWGSSSRPGSHEDPTLPEIEECCEQFIRREVSGVFFARFERIGQQGRPRSPMPRLAPTTRPPRS